MRSEYQGDIEIASDGEVVWVNEKICVGRFCRMAIDLLVDGELTFPVATSKGTTLNDWRLFQQLMRQHFKVTVSDEHMPDFIRP